jgi:phospholipid/cholesterol/gamma-HCH transport system ATP-binding protein
MQPFDANILEIEGVTKLFHGRAVLEDLSLSVRRGEAIAVLGASGSGKSVLLKLVIGLLKPDAGSIRLDGTDVVPLADVAPRADTLDAARTRMSMLFQGGALFDSLTVGENVAYPLRVRGGLGEDEIETRVRDRLALVGLAGIEALLPAELSGGMRKRVALARAIAGDPEVILYDEPTTGLDPLGARRIDALIRSLQRRLAVTSLVVTHDLASACAISDRIALLRDGRIRVVLPTDDFLISDLPEIRELREAVALGRAAAARRREARAEDDREEAADAC